MNKFRRFTLAGALGAIAAGVGWKAFAQGGHGYHGRFSIDERIDKMVKHLAIEIEATPEQQEKLAAIAKGAAKDLAPLRGQAMDTRKQAMELLAAPNVDRTALEKLRLSKLQHADAASRRITQALGDAAEVLTPEQRVKLAEHAARMGHRRHHRHWG